MSSTQLQTATGRFVWHDHQSGDPQRAQTFYGELLGWTTETWKPGEDDYPMITKNGQQHGGFGATQGGAPPHWIGHVVVDDADAAAKRAEAAGGSILVGPMDMPEVGKFVVIRDPQGAVISAYTPAGDGPVSEGAFAWDELHTTDIEAAKRFYGEVFGWTTSDTDMGAMGTYVMFRSGDTDRAGGMQQQPGEDAPPYWLIYTLTDDVDASTTKAKGLGANVFMEPMDIPGIGRFSIVADPTGAVFGLFQPPS